MTYTTMTTVSAGNTYAVARWNDQVKGNIEHLRDRQNVGVHAYTSASQTISSTSFGSGDTVTFSEVVDLGGDYASNTFTAPVAGFYTFDIGFEAESATTSNSSLSLWLATSTIGDQVFGEPHGGEVLDTGSNFIPYFHATASSANRPGRGHSSITLYLAASATVSVEAMNGSSNVNMTEKRLTIALLSAA